MDMSFPVCKAVCINKHRFEEKFGKSKVKVKEVQDETGSQSTKNSKKTFQVSAILFSGRLPALQSILNSRGKHCTSDFLSVIMALMSFFEVLQVQTRIQQGMKAAVTKASGYYYLLENQDKSDNVSTEDAADLAACLIQGGISAIYLKQKMLACVGREFLERSWVAGGQDGLTILGSRFPDDHGNLDLTVTYRIKVPFLPQNVGSLVLTQRECQRVWSGNRAPSGAGEEKEEETEADVIVYITETGSVYHTSLDCSYLKLSVQQIRHNEVVNYRSEDGSKYYACDRCEKGGSGFWVYITSSGNRFHTDPNCSALRRNVQSVHLSEVSGRHCCSRCAKGEDGGTDSQ